MREEIISGEYNLDVAADIYMMIDSKCVYNIGEGHLTHNKDGFHLVGEGGLDYTQDPKVSYSLYADYYWYEIADVICIGNSKALYYCLPKEKGDIVAKTRLATEELYKLNK